MVGVVEIVDDTVTLVIRFLAMEIISEDRLTQEIEAGTKNEKGVLEAAEPAKERHPCTDGQVPRKHGELRWVFTENRLAVFWTYGSSESAKEFDFLGS